MPEAPNFLILYTDQQQGYQLSCAGHVDLRTPHIDSLAARGALFERAYTPNSVCMPARQSLITGLNPRTHLVRQNGCRPRFAVPTIGSILADAGYRTHAVGKMHLEPTNLPPGVSRDEVDPADFPEAHALWQAGKITKLPLPYYGFETVDFANGHGDYVYGDYLAWLKATNPAAVPLLSRERSRKPMTGAWSSWKSSIPADLHVNHWVADRTIDFLSDSARTGRPFLCWSNFPDPHFPWCPSHPYDEMYDPEALTLPDDAECDLPKRPPSAAAFARSVFGKVSPSAIHGASLREITAHAYGMISHIDDEVGRILAALDATGLRENTVVVFMSDHGEMLGKRGLLAKGPYHFEELIRVPLIVSCPARFRAGVVARCVVSALDVPVTIVDLAGCAYPEHPWAAAAADHGLPKALQGTSLLPVLTGKADKVRDRVLVEFDEDGTGSVARARLRSLVTQRYKLNYYAGEDVGEIYDLENDPREHKNLWDDPGARRLRAQLMEELVDEVIFTESWLPRRVTSS
ncbi:MAG: sulfatase-like hydrolase/transferase [Planctomycetota bacterium]